MAMAHRNMSEAEENVMEVLDAPMGPLLISKLEVFCMRLFHDTLY